MKRTVRKRVFTGILAASIVMSNLSGTSLVVHAQETGSVEVTGSAEESVLNETVDIEEQQPSQEIVSEDTTAEMEEESREEQPQEDSSTENSTEETEKSTTEECTTEESTTEECTTEEIMTEECLTEDNLEDQTGEESLFASVYLQFEANGGQCEVSLIELPPDDWKIELPQARREGYRFLGWYMDSECSIPFDESNLFWEAGSTYVLYAGYERIEKEEILLVEKTLEQSVNGVTITVEGNMPAEAELAVEVEELTRKEQENIAQASDILETAEELDMPSNISYSYDISILYQDIEYEPYLFDEMMQVTFSFDNEEELKDASELEIFHIDQNENVEKIEIKESSEKDVSFDADAFSTYILITKVEYTGNKNWTYGFTGDVQTFTAPVSGQYVFECYGAGTGNSKGSFAKGTIGLKKNETIYIYVGGQNNTFNGGGQGGAVWHSASNSQGSFSGNVESYHGCGATDVRIGTELETRMIVAGGGGGNGHEGGVNYSYNGFDVSGGSFYSNVYATNGISSNDVLGQGSSYNTWVNSGDWGSGSYPNHGTYSYRVVTGGGGGGYYGGNSGYAGTSKVIPSVDYLGKTYQVTDSVVENLVYTGNGKCQISLYSLEADVITYYNHNMTKLGEAAGLTGSYVNFPQLSETPTRPSDSKYDYTYLGWDDMATEEIEHYTDAQTVAAALYGDRNYIAAYESIGKSYTVTLDSADAQNAGTTGIMASYHSPLPDIAIPVKEGAIFAGYYTEQNGAGVQIYSAEGKGLTLSEFDQDSVIYAHWVQPITNVKSPENKEVLAGYAGVILTTEAELNPVSGYTLSYQWYMNHENTNTGGNLIQDADSRKLVIPQGFSTGDYYFYCLITATSASNGQSVSISTDPAKLSVEKGTIGMEYVEVENANCVYDGTPKTLAAAINNSNEHKIYYGTEPLSTENYLIKGSTVPNSYTDAGSYTNYIYVIGADFTDFSGSITMNMQKAEPRVYLSSKNTAYHGENQTVDAARIYGVDDKELQVDTAYVYFMDEACTKKTDSSCGALQEGGAPSAVGTYYVHAVTAETTNYKAVTTKNPAMFNILGTNIKYSVSGYHGIYDGKPHGLCVVNEDAANARIYFSDMVALTRDNYQTAGTVIPYEYIQVGRYPVYYFVVTRLAGGIDQYESGMAEIIIEEAKQNGGNNNSGNHDNPGNGSNGGNSDNTGSNQGGNHTNSETGTIKPHTHDYQLMSFDQPTPTKEGKAVYQCIECGHELVITYPATGENTKEEVSKPADIVEDSKPEKKEPVKNKVTKPDETVKENSVQPDTQEIKQIKEESRVLSEAELSKIANTLSGLTEEQIRELYEKGLLNMTKEEFERLLAMVRAQIVIAEEQVGLSENTLLTEEAESQDTTKQPEAMWNFLGAFLLGAAVMFLIREVMEANRKVKKTSK